MVIFVCYHSNVSRNPGQAVSVTNPLRLPSNISLVNFLTQRPRLYLHVYVCVVSVRAFVVGLIIE